MADGERAHRHIQDWRVVSDAPEPTYYFTERGARTAAALRIARSGRGAARVEHRTDDEWHACPAAEVLHADAGKVPERRHAWGPKHRRPITKEEIDA